MSSAGQQLVAGRIPGERIASTKIESNGLAFTTTETVLLGVTAPVVAGRTYEIHAYFKVGSTVDNDDCRARIKRDSVVGVTIQEDTRELDTDAQGTEGQTFHLISEYPASATENKTFVVTGDRLSGTGDLSLRAASTHPAFLNVYYVEG